MNDKKIDLVLDNDREWRKLLLEQQDTLFKKVDDLSDKFSNRCIEDEKRLTKLEVKSGVWGVIGGIVSHLGLNFWK